MFIRQMKTEKEGGRGKSGVHKADENRKEGGRGKSGVHKADKNRKRRR
ncbi:hypothetical protein [Niallia circulans]|nr:hypothetical protein [Niallia circulans]